MPIIGMTKSTVILTDVAYVYTTPVLMLFVPSDEMKLIKLMP